MAIALTVLAVALGLAVAALAYQRFEGNAVEGDTAAYEVLDEQTVSITISVTRKDPAIPVVCIVRRAPAVAPKPAAGRSWLARPRQRLCRSRQL